MTINLGSSELLVIRKNDRLLWKIICRDMSLQFLQCLLPGANLLRLERYEIDAENHQLTLSVSSTQTLALCPLCFNSTARIHSHYERTLMDLPCVSFRMTLVMQVYKFFWITQNAFVASLQSVLPKLYLLGQERQLDWFRRYRPLD
jgi:zinc-finger of transposase IS204/IS1001/IS1096/IS1165